MKMLLTRYGRRGDKRKRSSRSKFSQRKSSRSSAYAPTIVHSRGTNPQNAVSFRGHGFPDRLTTNLVFADNFILDPNAGTPSPFLVFRLTSLFDPVFAIGGGQPTYFDQLAQIYRRYIVNGAKITATFSRGTTTAADIGPYICGIQCSDQSTLPSTSMGTLVSSPNVVHKMVSQEDGSVSVTQTYSRKQTYPDNDTNLQARTDANPAVEWLAKVFASPVGINIEAPINCFLVIEYNATFSDVTQVVDL